MGTDISKEAMKLALEALEVATTPLAKDRQEVLRAQAALRQAIEQAEKQEPVGYFTINDYDKWEQIDGMSGKPLYEAPQPCHTCEALARTVMMDQTSHDITPQVTPQVQREWVGLTYEERMNIINRLTGQDWVYAVDAIEAKLKEKNQ